MDAEFGTASSIADNGNHLSLTMNASNGTLILGGSNSYSGSTTVDGGTLQVASGSLASPTQYVGYSATGTLLQSGGVNALGGAGELYLGYNASGNGKYNLSGGSLSSGLSENIGGPGTGTFTQSGGTNSAGSLILAQSTASTGTYNLNGGSLAVSALTQGAGTAAFNFGGGTLGASAAWSSSLAMTLTGFGGNGTVDTTGGSISLTASWPARAV